MQRTIAAPLAPWPAATVTAPRYTAQIPVPVAGYCIALAVAALIFPRLIEFAPEKLHAAFLLLMLGVLVAALSSAFVRPFRNGITIALLGFTFCAGLSIPFSAWRGGSMQSFYGWGASLLAFLVIASLLDTIDRCRAAMVALAASTLILVALSLYLGTDSNPMSRFSMNLPGTLGNPNIAAMILLMGAPFCIFAAGYWRGIRRVVALLAVAVIAVSVLRTGSRAGLLALCITVFLLLLRVSIGQKIALIIAVSLLGIAGLSLSHGNALNRLKILWNRNASAPLSPDEISAVESSTQRALLLHRSLVLTAQHPLLGVGMGMFMVADNDAAAEEGQRGMWRVTHNAYTEISSETGLPAFCFYAAAMFLCFRKLKRIRRKIGPIAEFASIESMAYALRLVLIVYAASSFFASTAYECYFPIVAGLCVAFESAVWQRIRDYEARPLPAPSAAPVPLRRAAAV